MIQLTDKQFVFLSELSNSIDVELKSVSIEVSPQSLNVRVYTLDGAGTLLHMTNVEERKLDHNGVLALASERAAKVT